MEIKEVVKFGKWHRYKHLEGKRFVALAVFNAGMGIWNLCDPGLHSLFSLLSLAGVILCIHALIRLNIVKMPEWAKDTWEDQC